MKIHWRHWPQHVECRIYLNQVLPDTEMEKFKRQILLSLSFIYPRRLYLTLFIEWLRFLVLIAYIKRNNDSTKFVQKIRKKWYSTRSTLNGKSSSSRESLATVHLCVTVIHHQVCTKMRATLTIKELYDQGHINYFGEGAKKTVTWYKLWGW